MRCVDRPNGLILLSNLNSYSSHPLAISHSLAQALTAGLTQALMILCVSGKQGLLPAQQALTRCGGSALLEDLKALATQVVAILDPVEAVFGPWLPALCA